MSVKLILDEKGRNVVTVERGATLAQAMKLLGEKGIGALIVSAGDDRISGILSERDIVRVLAQQGADAFGLPIESVMTAKVQTCTEENTINEVMEIMTRRRFRHMPVEKDGKLIGIISIGDVVKRRIEDVEREAEQIREYIATA